MSSTATVLYLLILLVLPISALLARRLPMRNVVYMALAWIAIFVVALVAVDIVSGIRSSG